MQEIMLICWPSSHTEYRLDCVTGGGFIYHVQRSDFVLCDYTRRSHAPYQQRGRRYCVDLRQRDDLQGYTLARPPRRAKSKPTMLAN